MVKYRQIYVLCGKFTNYLAATRTLERSPRPPNACGTKKWGDTQRAPHQLRYVDESYPQRSRANKPRRRQIL